MKPEVVTVVEAGRLLGLGRTSAYRAARRGNLPVVRIGRRRLAVPRPALEELLRSPVRGEVVLRCVDCGNVNRGEVPCACGRRRLRKLRPDEVRTWQACREMSADERARAVMVRCGMEG